MDDNYLQFLAELYETEEEIYGKYAHYSET